MSTKMKFLVYGLMVTGGGVLIYSVIIINTPLMIIGFGLMLLSFFIYLPFDFKQISDNHLKQKKVFNEIIELVKDDKLKDAFDLNEKEIIDPKLKTYLQGLIFGTQFKGDELDQVKFEFKNK